MTSNQVYLFFLILRVAFYQCLSILTALFLKFSRKNGFGECSSVGRASGCGSEGRGFDPHHSPQIIQTRIMSGCSAAGSALALGARGRQFESGHPDQSSFARALPKSSSKLRLTEQSKPPFYPYIPMITIDRRYIIYFDWISLAITLAICAIGLAFVYSSTETAAIPYSPYFKKQCFGLLSGFLLYFLFCCIDHRILCRIGYFTYFLVIALLLFTLVKGKVGMGAQRWIDLKIVKFQPSELVKIFFPPFITYYLYSENDVPRYTIHTFLPIVAVLLFSSVLVVKQPDLGTGIVLCASGFTMLWFSGIGKRFFYVCLLIGILCIPLSNRFLKEYQKRRIMVFLGAGDALKERYHIEQSKIAIGSGKITGKGFCNGTQNKLMFLPERRTDSIFSVLCEEWGLVGACILILLYVMLFFRILYRLERVKSFFGQLLGVGLLIPIMLATLINMCMVCGLMPIVGIPLPLMSYGVTALWITLISLGWIQGIIMRAF